MGAAKWNSVRSKGQAPAVMSRDDGGSTHIWPASTRIVEEEEPPAVQPADIDPHRIVLSRASGPSRHRPGTLPAELIDIADRRRESLRQYAPATRAARLVGVGLECHYGVFDRSIQFGAD